MSDYTKLIELLEAEVEQLRGYVILSARLEREKADLQAEVERLRAAIRWALGEEGTFAERLADGPMYWWRTELRKRAALEQSDE